MTKHILFLIVFLIPGLAIIPGCKPDKEKTTYIAGNKIMSIYIDANGLKWFATDKGISSFDGKNWKNYDSKDGLPAGLINDIDASSANTETGLTLWLASNHGAAMANVHPDIISVKTIWNKSNSEITSDTVLSIHIDPNNYLWFGTNKGLAGVRDTQNWILPENYIFTHYPVTHIGSSNNGWNYFATLGGGIGRNKTAIDGVTSASTYEIPWADLPSDSICSVYIEASGNQWFGTSNGIAYHQGTETKLGWTVYTTHVGLVNNFVLSIGEDSQGNVWFGTRGGVSKYNKSTWTSFTMADGLADNTVYSIAFDGEGSVWFGTANGVSHYNGTWTTYRSN